MAFENLGANILALAVMVGFGYLIWLKLNKEKLNTGKELLGKLIFGSKK